MLFSFSLSIFVTCLLEMHSFNLHNFKVFPCLVNLDLVIFSYFLSLSLMT
uniref:Uncharacterized protein n=1 Tax=Rhizophora mucronata TaxID=61149 RepID=A0A2P2J498_RHIMU